MWQFLLAVIGGFALLVWGADRFVVGAAATARNLGVAPLIIGLTIVGMGTSAPEMLVSAMAAWDGNPGLGMGNAVGSNIANIGLIIGLTALIVPLRVSSITLRREFPVLLGIMLAAYLLVADGDLSRSDGTVLLLGLAGMLVWLVWLGLNSRGDTIDPLLTEYTEEIPVGMAMPTALGWLALGLVVLLVSSRVLIWGAIGIAETMGVSDLIIGLTLVALGTSLPELAAAVVSALKGEHDIALGNVIGSNMFNLLGVLGLPGLIHPAVVEPEMLSRDFSVMAGLTVLLLIFAYSYRRRARRINRFEGSVLLLLYLSYIGLLYWSIAPQQI
ncbi:calcium/sodium antiporter [Thiohalobacter thiocyanaticus]|uniref:Calcium/sodium antiporter n=1 Tax=Thiohalobacter thiocyanaticus TaxID=585455 RepID=A0A426QMN2_9GAMM|nr:calcium/sodium antiporter [Thiohalobacter thiocyanaticus]RRQ23025.1 calcium/sodium antiporter [Thiohalobacter thiocyanaticus]